jgi:hypothetical protein
MAEPFVGAAGEPTQNILPADPDTTSTAKGFGFVPESTVKWNHETHELTHKEKILGWAVPLIVVVLTIVASYMPGLLGEATRQFFFIQR